MVYDAYMTGNVTCFRPEKCRNDFEEKTGVWFQQTKGNPLPNFLVERGIILFFSGLSFVVVVLFPYCGVRTFPQKMLPVCRPTFVGIVTPVRPRGGVSANWSVVVL